MRTDRDLSNLKIHMRLNYEKEKKKERNSYTNKILHTLLRNRSANLYKDAMYPPFFFIHFIIPEKNGTQHLRTPVSSASYSSPFDWSVSSSMSFPHVSLSKSEFLN